jgi:FAD/FMN-containing dehydrogenase
MQDQDKRSKDVVLGEPAKQALRGRLRGPLLCPGDEGYEPARRVYNGMIDRRPAAIVRCADAADVLHAIRFARDQGLIVAVRGGSHNVAGFATCDGGLVIDLSRMRGVRVDPQRRVAHAEGGCTWGDFDHATHAFGLATPGGVLSTTGVAGLTLGGGFGYLTRKYGLSCDNLVSADVVTADGRLITASEDENEDLFWGLRGGGGNFGVVTSFEFQVHPVSTVIGGPLLYPLEKAGEALQFFRDYMAKASDDMNTFFAFLIVPPGPPFPPQLHLKTVCGIVACWAGPKEKAEEAFAPLRRFGPPLLDLVGPLPYPALQGMFDPLLPPGLQHYWKADFVNAIDDRSIDVHLKYGPKIPTVQSVMHIYSLGGAVARVEKSKTAFSYRDARYVHIIAGVGEDAAGNESRTAWTREYWTKLRPYAAGGAYVNFLMEEGDERIQAAYGAATYERLVALKNKLDPTNFFRLNQNIRPTV